MGIWSGRRVVVAVVEDMSYLIMVISIIIGTKLVLNFYLLLHVTTGMQLWPHPVHRCPHDWLNQVRIADQCNKPLVNMASI